MCWDASACPVTLPRFVFCCSLTSSESHHRTHKPEGVARLLDQAPFHPSIVIAADKIPLPLCPNSCFVIPATPFRTQIHSSKWCAPSHPSRCAKTLFFHSHNVKTLLAMLKHFSCHSRHAKTLVLPFPHAKTHFLPFRLHQNTCLAIPATPKHFSYHSRCTETLFIPMHYTWSHLAMPGRYLAISGIDLAALVIHLATYGNTWQHLVTSYGQISLFHYITKRCQYLNISFLNLNYAHMFCILT